MNTKRTVGEPLDVIDLVPTLDPLTGQTVFAEPDLVDDVDRVGLRARMQQPDVQLVRGGITTTRADGTTNVSILPSDVMASDGWDDIRKALGDAERGRTRNDVVLQPGGELTLSPSKPGAPRPVSTLPRDVMASGPSISDVDVLRTLDPHNIEQWTPHKIGMIPGWTFVLQSGRPGIEPFHFLTFRSPVDGGSWRTAALRPNLDSRIGHNWHMTTVSIAGQQLPVICGPGGAASRTLTEVRVDAAKWKTYVAARLAGVDPGFSR